MTRDACLVPLGMLWRGRVLASGQFTFPYIGAMDETLPMWYPSPILFCKVFILDILSLDLFCKLFIPDILSAKYS